MPRYTVTYTTNTAPTDLPDGATVEKIRAYPLNFDEGTIERRFHLNASAHDDDVAFFAIGGRGVHLDRDQTIQVRDALNELLSESAPVEEWDGHSEPPADVVETRDCEGDRWYRLADGTWSTNGHASEGTSWDEPRICPADYTPHTIIRRK